MCPPVSTQDLQIFIKIHSAILDMLLANKKVQTWHTKSQILTSLYMFPKQHFKQKLHKSYLVQDSSVLGCHVVPIGETIGKCLPVNRA